MNEFSGDDIFVCLPENYRYQSQIKGEDLFSAMEGKDTIPRYISTAEMRGNSNSSIERSCPKPQSRSPVSLRGTDGVPKAWERRMTRMAAPTAMANRNRMPAACIHLSQARLLLWRYQTPRMKTMHWPAITPIVPAIDIAAFEAAAWGGICQTQAIGRVGFKSFITACRTKTPNTIDNTRLTNIRAWRSHRRTQSRLKSLTRANRVARCVAVDKSDSIQIIKKWYGTMVSIFASPTLCRPIPVMICWSEKESNSFLNILASFFRRSSWKMIIALKMMAMPAVITKESST